MQIKRPVIIDLSAWEHDTNWEAQRTDPPLLMITRLTLGKYYVDSMAASHIAGARSIGSKVGVYHFMEFNDVQGQVDNFLNAARNIGALVGGRWTLDVPPILDVEKEPGGRAILARSLKNVSKRAQIPPWETQPKNSVFDAVRLVFNGDPEGDSWAYQIKTWLDAVGAATGITPLMPQWIYTNLYYWSKTFSRDGKPPAWTADYELWDAQYFDEPDLHEVPSPLPEGWSHWYVWQYSASGRLPLCPYDGIDMNKASNQLLEDLGNPLPPPDNEGVPSMFKYTFVCQNAPYSKLNLWSLPSASSVDVGDLLNGDTAEGDELTTLSNGEKWLKVENARGAPYPTQPAYVAVFYGGTSRGTLTENTITPPAGDVVIEQTIEQFVNGEKYIPEQGNPVKFVKA